MKKILIPTDFSKTAEAAIDYGLHLLNDEPAELHILHAYRVPIIDPMTPLIMIEDFTTQQHRLAEEHFKEYAKEFVKRHPVAKGKDIKIITHLDVGMGVEVITAAENEIQPDLIVMGTNGSTAHRFRIGSIAARTARKVKTPIIMVPVNAKYTPPKKIVFATNYKEAEAEVLLELLKQYNPEKTKIYCVHVSKELDITEELRLVEFREQFKSEIVNGLIHLDVETADYIEQGINKYIEKKQADMVVLLHTNKNLMQKIFTSSITSEVVFNANVPVMVYQQKKKEA